MEPRNTKAKSMILSSLKAAKQALSQEEVQASLNESVDRATVYRVLNRFCQEGLVHKVVSDDGKQYFAVCVNCKQEKHLHNHFHFRCLRCGKVECLKQEISLNLPAGYEAEVFNGFVSGKCAACG